MRTHYIQALLVVALLAGSCPSVQAAPMTFSETLSERIKCTKIDGLPSCEKERVGKYRAGFRIPASVLVRHEFLVFNINDQTVFNLSLGDFGFESAVKDAVVKADNAALWLGFHLKCNSRGDCKPVVDSKVFGFIGFTSFDIKASGSHYAIGESEYGQSLFASLCLANDDGFAFSAPVEVHIDNLILTATANGTCRKKIQTKIKYDQPFELTSVVVKGTVDDLQ